MVGGGVYQSVIYLFLSSCSALIMSTSWMATCVIAVRSVHVLVLQSAARSDTLLVHLPVLRAAATAGGAGLGTDSVRGSGVTVSTRHALRLLSHPCKLKFVPFFGPSQTRQTGFATRS